MDRRARADDAEAIADVHVRSWRSPNAGMLPDEVIEQMAAGRDVRVEHFRGWLGEMDGIRHGWVAVENGAVIGMAVTVPSRDPDAGPSTGELEAIYLAPEAIGRGVDRQLIQAAISDLYERGFTDATLWILRENQQARDFYEAAGWETARATKDEERPGGTLREIRYRRALQ